MLADSQATVQGPKAGQGCWDLQGSTWVLICIWGEVVLLCRAEQMPRAGEQQECVGFRAGWHFRMRLPANSYDYKMPVIKLKILCHFLSSFSACTVIPFMTELIYI